MYHRKSPAFLVSLFLISFVLFSCGNEHSHLDKDNVKSPAQMDEHVGGDLKKLLEFAASHGDKLNDTSLLQYRGLMDSLYNANGYSPLWSDKEHFLAKGDSLFSFISQSNHYGLFPTDYHYTSLGFIYRLFKEDTLSRKNAAMWARADLLFTDAFLTLAKDLKHGRLPFDSVMMRKDSILPSGFYTSVLDRAIHAPGSDSMEHVLTALQPTLPGYDSLKTYLAGFLETAHFRNLTWLDYPYKDSAAFYARLGKRLQEVGYIDSSASTTDTAVIASAIRKYQSTNKLKVTGKPNQDLVTMMNNSDWEKFKRIAINMDRYKLMPDSLPSTYVWVNLPSFYLQVHNADTIALESRVIVGAPKTRTPLLTSEISNFLTMPQWTVPNSIIFKEMLPQIKANVDYLRKQNLIVVDSRDSVRDPSKIKWSKLNKDNFPYQLKQRQGDDNSLGVMKFNFKNKYDVYLHDTNGRWMFGKSFRALSHGCVRVKEFMKLADFLIRNDTIRYKPDTLKAWISRQEKHWVTGFAKVPIYLRYFTAEGKNGKISFYDDIYGEDKAIRNRYFADKPIY